jgi:hypothetical protein
LDEEKWLGAFIMPLVGKIRALASDAIQPSISSMQQPAELRTIVLAVIVILTMVANIL